MILLYLFKLSKSISIKLKFWIFYRVRIWERYILLNKNDKSYDIFRIGPRGGVYKSLSE